MNMFGYDDDQLNQILFGLVKDPTVMVQVALDKSQATGRQDGRGQSNVKGTSKTVLILRVPVRSADRALVITRSIGVQCANSVHPALPCSASSRRATLEGGHMAESAQTSVPKGPHAPVSNQPDEVEVVRVSVSEPPSEGAAGKPNPVTDGTEDVKKTEASLSELSPRRLVPSCGISVKLPSGLPHPHLRPFMARMTASRSRTRPFTPGVCTLPS
jgi:hypothetical protein